MPGMYAEALPAIGAVRVVLDVSDWPFKPDQVQLFRGLVPPSSPDWPASVVKVRVRPTYVLDDPYPQYGYPFEMTAGGVDVWYDSEAPLDVPVWYAAELINGSGSYAYAQAATYVVAQKFDAGGLSGWVADTGGTVAANTATPISGVRSLRLTANGGVATIGTRSARTAVNTIVPGHLYAAEVVVRPGVAASDLRVAVDWALAAGTFLTSAIATVPLTAPAGVAVRRRFVFTAPATANRVELRVRWSGTPAAGTFVDVDDASLIDMGDAASMAGATPVTLASNAGGWLSNPERPYDGVRLSLLPDDDCDTAPAGVIFLSHAADARAAAGSRFDVVDQAAPSVVLGRRKLPTSTLTLAALSHADRDTVHELLDDGAVLLLRVPPEFGIGDRNLDVGDVSTAALTDDLRLPYRVIDLPYAQAGTPGGPTSGVLGDRFTDLNRYPTWTAFDAAGLTSIDLLLGKGSTLGVGAL